MLNKEKRQKMTVNVAQGLSLFVIFIGVFLGLLYTFDGNLFVAAPLSIVVLIAIYFFVDNLVAAKMNRKRSGFSMGIRLSLALLMLISIPISVLIMHAVNVEFFEKNYIVTIGKNKIEVLGKLKMEYTQNYSQYLSARRQAIVDNLTKFDNGMIGASDVKNVLKVGDSFIQSHTKGWPSISADAYISTERLKFLRADTSIFGNTESYLKEQSRKVAAWNRFAINNAMNELDTNVTKTHYELNKFLVENAFDYSLKELDPRGLKANLLSSPIALLKKHFGVSHGILVILIYFLLFLPYFIAPGRIYNTKKKKSDQNINGIQAPTNRGYK